MLSKAQLLQIGILLAVFSGGGIALLMRAAPTDS